jgi:DNA-binding XRE family transcriptional regulator
MIISPEQCRAARGWLGWSQQELALRARVGRSTVKSFERGDRQPMVNNLVAMARVFEEAGIRQIFSDGIPIGIGILSK